MEKKHREKIHNTGKTRGKDKKFYHDCNVPTLNLLLYQQISASHNWFSQSIFFHPHVKINIKTSRWKLNIFPSFALSPICDNIQAFVNYHYFKA